jgi:cyclopropane-fatty-acyl-phospholipid synthase
MRLFSLEQDRALVRMDMAFYGLVAALLALVVLARVPADHAGRAAAAVLAGTLGWTLMEYGLHRFVLHRLQPFKRWHALHHERPAALIATPTALTAALFVVFVAAPSAWLAPLWLASALDLGVMLGYLAYIVTHHRVHHGHTSLGWLRQRQRWHAQHHQAGSQACYGVSVPVWDHVFGSARPRVRQRTDSSPLPP